MTESQVEGQLARGNLTITTSTATNPTGQNGDIFVNSGIFWSSNSTLTLSTYRDINIASSVTIQNGPANPGDPNPSGNLVLRADNAGNGIGTVNFITIPGVDDGRRLLARLIFPPAVALSRYSTTRRAILPAVSSTARATPPRRTTLHLC
jgi:hypothetical protein